MTLLHDPTAGLSVEAAREQVLQYWADSVSDATVARVAAVLKRFSGWCDGHDVTDVGRVDTEFVRRFVFAPLPGGEAPWPATMDGRRAAVRIMFRQLRAAGVAVGDPTVDVRVPGRVRRSARPLTDEEVLLGRQTAQLRSASGGGYAEAGWALAEAGAITSEIAQVRVRDLELDREDGLGQVRLVGSRRHDPRCVELTPWAVAVLACRVETLHGAGQGEDALLAYRGQAVAGAAASQSAVCTSLRSVLLQSGLAEAEDQVRPASIRHWAGRSRYDQGWPLERVARWLGMRSLDATVYDLGICWRDVAPPSRNLSAGGPATDAADEPAGAPAAFSPGGAGGDR